MENLTLNCLIDDSDLTQAEFDDEGVFVLQNSCTEDDATITNYFTKEQAKELADFIYKNVGGNNPTTKIISTIQSYFKKIDRGECAEEIIRMLLLHRNEIESFKINE